MGEDHVGCLLPVTSLGTDKTAAHNSAANSVPYKKQDYLYLAEQPVMSIFSSISAQILHSSKASKIY
jgi:hypothetical protein